MPFPSKRFRLAGATDTELDALEAEHLSLPENMRAVNEQHFSTLDTDGLRQALEVRRGAGIPEVEAEQPERDSEDLAAVRALLNQKPKHTRSKAK